MNDEFEGYNRLLGFVFLCLLFFFFFVSESFNKTCENLTLFKEHYASNFFSNGINSLLSLLRYTLYCWISLNLLHHEYSDLFSLFTHEITSGFALAVNKSANLLCAPLHVTLLFLCRIRSSFHSFVNYRCYLIKTPLIDNSFKLKFLAQKLPSSYNKQQP